MANKRSKLQDSLVFFTYTKLLCYWGWGKPWSWICNRAYIFVKETTLDHSGDFYLVENCIHHVYSNNCTRIKYNNVQTCGKLATFFVLFVCLQGSISAKKTTVMAS